jgi:hypothetical protein
MMHGQRNVKLRDTRKEIVDFLQFYESV